jgi:plastocyanin
MRRLALPTAVLLSVLVAGQAMSAEKSVLVKDDFYDPDRVTVMPGDTVRWSWQGGNPHDVKSDPGQKESFNSGPPTSTRLPFTHVFTKPGRYRYYCSEHGTSGGVGMSGRVTVLDSDGSPPGPPKISGFKVDPKKFCKTKTDRCPKTGTTVRYTLSADAIVLLRVIRRSDNKVVKTLINNRPRKKGKRAFTWKGSGLAKGKYRLSLRARDNAGNRSFKSAFAEIASSR